MHKAFHNNNSKGSIGRRLVSDDKRVVKKEVNKHWWRSGDSILGEALNRGFV